MPKKDLSFPSHKYKDIDISTLTTLSPQPLDQSVLTEAWGDNTTFGKRTSHPNHLLLTLLGDYWWRRTEHLPSAALVALLTEFGVSDVAARATLNRLAQQDFLVTSKHGRQTHYGMSKRTVHILDEGTRRIFSFGTDRHCWDGMWSLVAFSIPEEQRKLRYVLRDRLRWLGFAPFYDGLWISPHDHLSEVANELARLSISVVTMFRASITESTPEAGSPLRAWDLVALRTQYEQFITKVQPLCVRINRGDISPEEALIARTEIMDTWCDFPTFDPDLPDVLLPPDWPRASARQLFIEVYDALGPLAQRRIQHIVGRYAPDLAKYTNCHDSNVLLSAEFTE